MTFEHVALNWMFTAIFGLVAYRVRLSDWRRIPWMACALSALVSVAATSYWLWVVK